MLSDGRTPSDESRLTGLGLAGAIAAVSFGTLAGAWVFQWAGYPPCELCLKGRVPHYAGIPLALVVAWLAERGRSALLPAGFLALTLIYAAGTLFALYHAGVEWHFWAGPASCTGSYAAAEKVGDFLQQLQRANVVRCDAPALKVLGLSLAAWNMLICLALTVLAGRGLSRALRGRASTLA